LLQDKTPIAVNVHVGEYLPWWRPGTDCRTCYSAKSNQGWGVVFDIRSGTKNPRICRSALRPSNAQVSWQHTFLEHDREADAVYFVHSFMAVPGNSAHRIADCLYGGHKIAATIGRDQIAGCQFHPEKNGEVGLKILHMHVLQ
jgi:hypothetical protein